MNHLSRKKKLYGAGSKKPEVKPAVLLPPRIGDFQFGASFSYIETLDLISDGPIEGLVDSKGNLLSNSNLSRGVYLDGTPVAVGVQDDKDIEEDTSIKDTPTITKSITTFDNLNSRENGGAGASVLDFMNHEYDWGGKFMHWINTIRLVNNAEPLISIEKDKIFEKESSFVYYSDLKDIRITNSGMDGRYEYIFANGEDLASEDTDFAVGFYLNNDKKQFKKYSLGSSKIVNWFFSYKYNQTPNTFNDSRSLFFQEILDAYYGYYEDNNKFMRDVIKNKMDKVFYNGWTDKTAQELADIFFDGSFGGYRSGHVAIYYPKRSILNGLTGITFNSAEEVKFILTDENGVESKVMRGTDYVDLLIPRCNANREVQTDLDIIGGAFIFKKHDFSYFKPEDGVLYKHTYDFNISKTIDHLKNVTKLSLVQKVSNLKDNSKYNYNNVLIEYRDGKEIQDPFRYFNKVYIDKSVQKNVYGPYKKGGQVQRIKRDTTQGKNNFSMEVVDYSGPNLTLVNHLPTNEGSNDSLRDNETTDAAGKNFSSWNNKNKDYLIEEAGSPITYTINNPNVSEVFVTLQIDSLYDTVEMSYGDKDEDFKVGDKLPAIMNVEIEVGKILSDGTILPTTVKTYRIAALIEGATLLDIGNPHNRQQNAQYRHVRDLDNPLDTTDLSTPFSLPRVVNHSINNVSSSPEKRYVKVTKLSTETFSILISKELSFYKVTEMIPVNLMYPFSAIVGTKIDSKSFASTPQRSFDVRLKKVPIPKNYFPTEDDAPNKDKRYYDRKAEYENASSDRKSVYVGDWNGEFKMGWTDNPAWILYDLLTNTRYGLGQYVESSDINKWELYKIGRFCDAVDSRGNFVGVPDGRGGLEPRYSCNIMFKSDEKVFDSIQLISKLFRGHTFFRASEVSFTDERIKSPIATFNNNNVKDGVFNYSNLRRDQQFNTVEVSYLDRFENFTPKVEVIEDEEDIRSRGVFKKRIDGTGVTSRAMARRIGQHLIYRTIKENQRIAFTSGLEALLCQPGDLIIVDDDLKNQKSNFGKVLSVDVDKQYIELSGPYNSGSMTGILTVYNPTGETSISDLFDTALSKRHRAETFTITDNFSGFDEYTGLYNFSGYIDGYSEDEISNIESTNLYSEYALYTGIGNNILYYKKDPTGWVFATGMSDSDIDYITTQLTQTLAEVNTGSVSNYDDGVGDKRGTDVNSISGFLSGDLNVLGKRGILDSEINLNSQAQIISLNVTGEVYNTGFGSYVSGVDAPQYLQFIKLGSPYRFELREADDILYKIESIKENNPNEYLVAAAKFDTGKFSLIEDNISIEKKENTFDYNVATQIGDITYQTLSSPQNLTLSTGDGTDAETFYVSGSWDSVTNASSYEATIHYPNTSSFTSGVSNNFIKFDNLSAIGNYSLSVKALGSSVGSNSYLDSDLSTVRSFILYEDAEEFNKSFIQLITFR